MIIDIILVFLAAMSNAIMDTISHHWEKSIFRYTKNSPEGWGFLNLKWWYIFHMESWKNKYISPYPPYEKRKKWNFYLFKINKPVQFCDAWHFLKSLMIFCLIALPFFYEGMFHMFGNKPWNIAIDYMILGLVWNLTFNLFYNKLLIRKTYKK